MEFVCGQVNVLMEKEDGAFLVLFRLLLLLLLLFFGCPKIVFLFLFFFFLLLWRLVPKIEYLGSCCILHAAMHLKRTTKHSKTPVSPPADGAGVHCYPLDSVLQRSEQC